MARNNPYRSHCPINYTQEVLGDRWSLLIIRDMLFQNKHYYNEFLKSDEKISTNILADRLAKLEQNGIINSRWDEQNLSKKIYTLSAKGIDLMPILFEMIEWGMKYNDRTIVPPEFKKQLQADKPGFLQLMMQQASKQLLN